MPDTNISVGDYTKLRELFPEFREDQKEGISRKFKADTNSYKKYIMDVLKIAMYAICSNSISSIDDYQSEKTVKPINEAKAVIRNIINHYYFLFYPETAYNKLPINPRINISIGSGGAEGFYLICHIEIGEGDSMISQDIVYPGESFPAPNENKEPEVCKVYNSECPLCEDHLIEAIHPATCPHHIGCGCKCSTCVRREKCACYAILVKNNGGIDPATLVNINTLASGATITESYTVEKGTSTEVVFAPAGDRIFDYIAIDTTDPIGKVTYDDISKFNSDFADDEEINVRITYDDLAAQFKLCIGEVNADYMITVVFKERVVKPAPVTITLDTDDGVYVYNERDEYGYPIGTALHKGYDVYINDDCNIDFYVSKHAEFKSITIDGNTYDTLNNAMIMLDQIPNITMDRTPMDDIDNPYLYKLSFFDVTEPHHVEIRVELRKVQLEVVVNGEGYLYADSMVSSETREVYEGDTPSIDVYVPYGYHIDNILYNRDGDDIDENEVVYTDGGEYALGDYTTEDSKNALINRFTINDMEYSAYFEVNVVGDSITVPVKGVNCLVAPVDSDLYVEDINVSAVHGSDMTVKIALEHNGASNIDISRITKIRINDTEYAVYSTEDLVTKPTSVQGLFNLVDSGIEGNTQHIFTLTIFGAAVDATLDVEITAVRREFTISEKIINARVASPELPANYIYGSNVDVVITADFSTYFTSLVVTNGVVSATIAITSDTGKSVLYSFGYMEWDKLTRTYIVHFEDLKDNYTIMGSTVTFEFDNKTDMATTHDVDALFDDEESVTEDI